MDDVPLRVGITHKQKFEKEEGGGGDGGGGDDDKEAHVKRIVETNQLIATRRQQNAVAQH